MGGDRDRGRDRDRKKTKKRSLTSDSAERSREREARRRKQQQQFVAKSRKPEAVASAPGTAPAGQGMFWDGFQWVPRADTGTVMNDTRKSRRLWIGNLPYHLGVTEDAFSKQLYETMRDRGFCNDSNQNPVLHVYFARDKGANYGFCEIATVEETERALHLDGMMVLGVAVAIKRPNDSKEAPGAIANAPAAAPPPVPAAPAFATSPIIRIDELLKVDSRTTKDDYNDVVEDMSEGCGAHGKVLGVLIIRPENARARPGLKLGDVYLQCATTDDATKIMRAMGHRKYDGRQIAMTCFDEARFNAELRPLM